MALPERSRSPMRGGVAGLPALALRGAIRLYRYTLSSLVGRTCRHLPTCSEYADEAIRLHGAWAGFWIGLARFWRCGPFGTHGFDPVPETLPGEARWYRPWRYGRWGPRGDS
jgi:putative membrane protein insertion efficiency factor